MNSEHVTKDKLNFNIDLETIRFLHTNHPDPIVIEGVTKELWTCGFRHTLERRLRTGYVKISVNKLSTPCTQKTNGSRWIYSCIF